MLLPVIRAPFAHSTHSPGPLGLSCSSSVALTLHRVLCYSISRDAFGFSHFEHHFYEREEEQFILSVRVRFHRFGRARASEYRFSFLYVLTSPEKRRKLKIIERVWFFRRENYAKLIRTCVFRSNIEQFCKSFH